MQLRTLAFAVGTSFSALTLAPFVGPAYAAEGQPETTAQVDVTVKAGGADAVHLVARQLAWDSSATLRKSADDHEHAVAIGLRRSDDGQRIHVAVRYVLDGAAVVTERDVAANLAEPVRLASEDGKAEVVFVIHADAPRKRIEIDDSDDPLGGL
jgi:hypothetical protein